MKAIPVHLPVDLIKGQLRPLGGVNAGFILPVNISHSQDDFRQPLAAGFDSFV